MFKDNILLAPMAGVTDHTFRVICKAFGAGFTYTEMISAKGIFYNNKNTKSLLDLHNEPDTGVQLFGSEPDIIRYAAEYAEGARAALIDINMGCPARKIIKNREGCALMADISLAERIINAAVKAVNIPVTVKFRKGIDNLHINAVEFAKMAEGAGAYAMTVHGRTLDQYYSGKADIEIIKAVKQNVSIPVIGNGDVTSLESAATMIKETNCDAVMIARAALGNPWVFSGQKPTVDERISMALSHAKGLIEQKGEYTGVREARKHIGWYITGIKNAAILKVMINKAVSLAEFEEILRGLSKGGRVC